MINENIPCPCDTCELPIGSICELDLMIGTIDTFTQVNIKTICPHSDELLAHLDQNLKEIMVGAEL